MAAASLSSVFVPKSHVAARAEARAAFPCRHSALPLATRRSINVTRVQRALLQPKAVATSQPQLESTVQEVSDPKAALSLVKDQGYTVVDVRDPTQYDRAHIKGSVHIPLFILDEGSDANTLLKKQAHSAMVGNLYGLAFTKPNPSFLDQVQKAFPDKSSKLLLVCQEGLRSADAAEDLEELGYTNVAFLLRGLNRVPAGVFEKEGQRELKDAGKGGFVAIQTQFSIVLATILISALLFIEFFPDQAIKIFGTL